MLDDLDRRLLRRFQDDPSLGARELAEPLGLTAAAVWRRLESLRAKGVILGQRAVIDWAALGYTVEVSLRITLDKTQHRAFDEFLAAAREIPEVLEIQTFLGRVDVRLTVIARDMSHYRAIYRERILTLPHIAEIEALVRLSEVQTGEGLPI